MANLYTKTGDKGQTSLVGGTRVSKSDQRVECYGTIDEANSMLGLAKSLSRQEYVKETVHKIQGKLFSVGAELASDPSALADLKWKITEDDLTYLEQVADHCTEINGVQTHFVIPGVNQASAALHSARTIVRRAERAMIRLSEGGNPPRELLMRYVNRLSDTVYALARLEETLRSQEETREKVTELVREALNATAKKDGEQPPFCLAALKEMAARAEVKSKELGVPVVFAAVDEGGNLALLQRMEGALLGSVKVAAGKAYTACAFKLPTHVLGEEGKPSGSLYAIDTTDPGNIVLFGGGFPYVVDGKVVGGVGVSGGTVEQDMAIARYALNLA